MTGRQISIDVNCDMGELRTHVDDETQEAILPHITSVNIACGGHAGDEYTMRKTVEQAQRFGVTVGAHPSYPDRENFGRSEMPMPLDELSHTVFEQVRTLAQFASIAHVKPHGALYNRAAVDPDIAAAIARGVALWGGQAILVGLAGSVMLDVFARAGFEIAAEGFADRRYEADGTLRPRRFADALIADPALAAGQAVRLAQAGLGTICIHGDTPGAALIAAAVKEALFSAGIALRPISWR